MPEASRTNDSLEHKLCNDCGTSLIRYQKQCPSCISLSGNSNLISPRKRARSMSPVKSSLIPSAFVDMLIDSRKTQIYSLENELKILEKAKSDLKLSSASTTIAPLNEKLKQSFEVLSTSFSSHKNWAKIESDAEIVSKNWNIRCLASFKRSEAISSSPQIISSIEPSKTSSFFAAGGISKRISIYNLDNVVDSPSSVFPVIEIPTTTKISCLSWNYAFESHLVSSDYEGSISLHDTEVGKKIRSWTGHEKRIWSVDSGTLDPYRIISGSDDCKVNIWSYNSPTAVSSIDIRANVCSVRFSSINSNIFAVGAADHRLFVFDMRKMNKPIFSQKSHSKSVSYVRFFEDGSLISASTDCTVKLWSENESARKWESVQSYSGHVNEKNFVGLSTLGDYLVTGSENDSVYIYHRSIPSPITSYKFFSECPLTMTPMNDETGCFVSSVSWTKRTDNFGNPILLAANAVGTIKLLSLINE